MLDSNSTVLEKCNFVHKKSLNFVSEKVWEPWVCQFPVFTCITFLMISVISVKWMDCCAGNRYHLWHNFNQVHSIFAIFMASVKILNGLKWIVLKLMSSNTQDSIYFSKRMNIRHHWICAYYRQIPNIKHTWVGNKIVDHSDVVGASPVGAAPTTSSFST